MNRMNREEFDAFLHEQVTVQALDEAVFLTRKEGEGVQGLLTYTSGLTPALGFELVGFGVSNPNDLLVSALMVYSNYPRGFAVPIPAEILKELSANIPDVTYRQYIVDESVLDDETEAPSEDPMWVADGGYPILSDAELQVALTEATEKQSAEVRERIESVREQYRQKIEEFGWTVVGVFDAEGKQANFVYTVGLTNKELPELIVSGRLELDFLAQIANHFAQSMIGGGFSLRKLEKAFSLEDDTTYNLRMVQLDPVHALDRFLIQAQSILKKQVTAVCQIQISDASGKWPGEEGFEDKFQQLEVAPVIAS